MEGVKGGNGEPATGHRGRRDTYGKTVQSAMSPRLALPHKAGPESRSPLQVVHLGALPKMSVECGMQSEKLDKGNGFERTLFAPTGRRIVATGGAPAVAWRTVRNPWAGVDSTAPPRGGGGIVGMPAHQQRRVVAWATTRSRGVGAGHRRPFDGSGISFTPPGRKREERTPTPFPSSAFHGFSVGSQRGRAASPVATALAPRLGLKAMCAAGTWEPATGGQALKLPFLGRSFVVNLKP